MQKRRIHFLLKEVADLFTFITKSNAFFWTENQNLRAKKTCSPPWKWDNTHKMHYILWYKRLFFEARLRILSPLPPLYYVNFYRKTLFFLEKTNLVFELIPPSFFYMKFSVVLWSVKIHRISVVFYTKIPAALSSIKIQRISVVFDLKIPVIFLLRIFRNICINDFPLYFSKDFPVFFCLVFWKGFFGSVHRSFLFFIGNFYINFIRDLRLFMTDFR